MEYDPIDDEDLDDQYFREHQQDYEHGRGRGSFGKFDPEHIPDGSGHVTPALFIIIGYVALMFWFMYSYEKMGKAGYIFMGCVSLAFLGYVFFADEGSASLTCVTPDRKGNGLFATKLIGILPVLTLILVCLRLVLS